VWQLNGSLYVPTDIPSLGYVHNKRRYFTRNGFVSLQKSGIVKQNTKTSADHVIITHKPLDVRNEVFKHFPRVRWCMYREILEKYEPTTLKRPQGIITLIYLPTRSYYYVFMYSFTHKLKSCQFFFCPNPYLVFIFDILIIQRELWNENTKLRVRNLHKENLFHQRSMLISRSICELLWTLQRGNKLFILTKSHLSLQLWSYWMKYELSEGYQRATRGCYETWTLKYVLQQGTLFNLYQTMDRSEMGTRIL
jgi:hypothetical protein